MIVTCKQCDTRFNLDSGRIKPAGTKVRCSSCANVFRVYPPSGEPDFAPPGALDRPAAAGPLQERNAAEARLATAGSFQPPTGPADMPAGEDGKWDAFDFMQAAAAPASALVVKGNRGPGALAGAAETAPAEREVDEPLMLDLESLEIGPEVEDVEQAAFDFTVDAKISEVTGQPAAEPASELDLALAEAETDFDMEDILQSLEIEDAPVADELPDGDIESFDLLADSGSAAQESAATAAVSAGPVTVDELDPAEIEALLDLEGTAEEPSADAAGEMEAAAAEGESGGETSAGLWPEAPQADEAAVGFDLNLDQLENMIAGEEAFLLSRSDPKGTDGPAGVEGLPAALEAEAAAPEVGDDKDTVDGIDLADIEFLLDQEIEAEKSDLRASAAGGTADLEGPDEDLDLSSTEDLDLSLDFGPGEGSAAPPVDDSAVPEEAFQVTALEESLAEGLGFIEDLPPEAAAQAPSGDEGVLDFSDIEKLLEEEVDTAGGADGDEDLELVLDFPPDGGRPAAAVAEGEGPHPRSAEVPEDAAAELDESLALAEEVTDADVFDLDLDLEDIPQEFGGASIILEGEDGLELETLGSFDGNETISAEPAALPLVRDRRSKEEVEPKLFEMGGLDDDDIPAETMVGLPATKGTARLKPRRLKKTRKFFWLLLVLVLLGAGGYAAIHYFGVDVKDVRIPFVDRLFDKAPADNGALSVSLTDVQNRFVNNASTGILFVVTGRARNGYDHPRSYFEVKGVLNAKDGRPLKTMTAYCGNLLSDSDLAELDMAAIRMRLNNRAGANRSNLNVPPNRSVPFMLVFADLPRDLGEFAVEPAASAPAN